MPLEHFFEEMVLVLRLLRVKHGRAVEYLLLKRSVDRLIVSEPIGRIQAVYSNLNYTFSLNKSKIDIMEFDSYTRDSELLRLLLL